MLLAVLQGRAQTLEIGANLAAIDAAAGRAATRGATVLLTPELFPVGYAPLTVRAELDPATLPGLAGRLAAIAERHGIALVYSLPAVRENGDWNISATLVDRSGAELLSYAKVHLFGPEEQQAFAPADQPPAVVDFDGLRTSLLICYDVEFPEPVRAAVSRGAELLLVPTALGHGYASVPQVLLRARALESQLAIGYANHCGTEGGTRFGGGSIITGADGGVLAQAGSGEELLFAQINRAEIHSARADVPYLSDRRPDLYGRWEGR
ncbi:nitrilase-related carbon-nitrogen hydrolase [Paenarthrobacter sp. PH39-S1]|uniref:nitrilase-related carbon-nitrogen hydrolase n=1 Tax=Paenarthrobacter sp. PH39-S1 TaxID=3046204 RepID=UPI0024B99118|nr:nitrilase-related carbon-nitrogen hydrolase [Paenarthrobacter sp. PH39-S1]MDJ0354700.1 nitrilase-related carbon-nitrogen hydrolase [Paenarthrobacter sp. PH39-S1]